MADSAQPAADSTRDADSAPRPKSNRDELLALLDYVRVRLFGRLEELPVEEYLWEPVAGCWSVRAEEDGVYRAEQTYPDLDPAPVTTIAWRLWHIAMGCLSGYSDNFWESLDRRRGREWREWPVTPEAAVEAANREWDRFRGHVAAMDEAALARPLGPAAGPYAQDSYHALVLHALDELIHHAAEIAVLRDLYRASAGGTAWTPAG